MPAAGQIENEDLRRPVARGEKRDLPPVRAPAGARVGGCLGGHRAAVDHDDVGVGEAEVDFVYNSPDTVRAIAPPPGTDDSGRAGFVPAVTLSPVAVDTAVPPQRLRP